MNQRPTLSASPMGMTSHSSSHEMESQIRHPGRERAPNNTPYTRESVILQAELHRSNGLITESTRIGFTSLDRKGSQIEITDRNVKTVGIDAESERMSIDAGVTNILEGRCGRVDLVVVPCVHFSQRLQW